ncbi:MAG: orotate phosphoribosyltransferase [Desulfurococcaceae archaeon]
MSWLDIVVKELYRHGMVKLGKFKLSSGLESPFYIDMRRLYSYPDLARRIVSLLIRNAPLSDVEVLAGVATAGIPLASYMACLTHRPLAYVRSDRKNHGTESMVEGDVVGKKVAVIDDVVTTGTSIMRAIESLEKVGAIPIRAIVLIDREQGAREKLVAKNIELYALIRVTELFEILYSNGLIDENTYNEIQSYLKSFKNDK